MSKDNLVWLISNCVILYNQGGFRKLLKKLSCYGDKSRYKHSTMQQTYQYVVADIQYYRRFQQRRSYLLVCSWFKRNGKFNS